MKAIKKINNNVVICVDSNNNEMIAMGKGIGFKEVPRDISLSEIERTFYNLNESHVAIMKDLPEDVISFSGKMIDLAKNELNVEFTPNVVLSLADHIAFAIERCRNKIKVKMPLSYDIEQFYPKEYRVAEYVIKKMTKEFLIYVPSSEVYGVAMILINAQVENIDYSTSKEDFDEIADQITEIVEDHFHFLIDRKSFNYSRFATHLQYLYERLKKGEPIASGNRAMFNQIRQEYPDTFQCVNLIATYLKKILGKDLTDEEKLYLVLHVNRICVKEGL